MPHTQQEICAPLALLKSDGTLNQPGWARQPYWDYQRSEIAAPRWRIKEWDYYAVLSDDQQFAIAITVADLGYVGMFALCFIDLASGQYQQLDSLALLPMGKTLLPAVNQHGNIVHNSKTLSLQIDMQAGSRRLRFSAPNFTTADGRQGISGDLLLQQPADLESMNITSAWAENPKAFYYNCKINCLPTSGSFTLGQQTHQLDPKRDSAVLDWGRGVWTYQNRWYWSSASGHVDGQPFGFNLGYGFSDRSAASENVLIYAGKYTALRARDALQAGWADLIAFGRPFVANPDLPERLRTGAALNAPDAKTFYGGDARGYTDYPTLHELDAAAD